MSRSLLPVVILGLAIAVALPAAEAGWVVIDPPGLPSSGCTYVSYGFQPPDVDVNEDCLPGAPPSPEDAEDLGGESPVSDDSSNGLPGDVP